MNIKTHNSAKTKAYLKIGKEIKQYSLQRQMSAEVYENTFSIISCHKYQNQNEITQHTCKSSLKR